MHGVLNRGILRLYRRRAAGRDGNVFGVASGLGVLCRRDVSSAVIGRQRIGMGRGVDSGRWGDLDGIGQRAGHA